MPPCGPGLARTGRGGFTSAARKLWRLPSGSTGCLPVRRSGPAALYRRAAGPEVRTTAAVSYLLANSSRGATLRCFALASDLATTARSAAHPSSRAPQRFAASPSPRTSRPRLGPRLTRSILHPALVRAGNLHIFPVLRHRAAGHLDALRLQNAGDLLVRQRPRRIFLVNQLLHPALQAE